MIRRERRVGRQLEIDQQRAEKEERPEPRIDQRRVLAEPAESRAPREIALEHRPRVDVRLARDRAADVLLDPSMQLRRDDRASRRGSRRRARTARPDPIGSRRRSSSRRRSRCVTPSNGSRESRRFSAVRGMYDISPAKPRASHSSNADAVLSRPERRDSDEIEAEAVALRLDQLLDHESRTAQRA